MPEQIKKIGKLKAATSQVPEEVADIILNSPSNNHILFKVLINNKPFELIFDSGSSVSIINKQFLEEFGGTEVENPPLIAKLANGFTIVLDFCIEVDVTFDSSKFRHRFYVYQDLAESAILGIDFFDKAGLNIYSCNKATKDYEPGDLSLNLLFDEKTDHLYVLNMSNGSEETENNKGNTNLNLNSVFTVYLTGTQEPYSYQTKSNANKCPEEHNFDTFEFNIKTENPQEETCLMDLLREYKQLFAFKMTDIVGAKDVIHRIETGDTEPINQRNYRYGFYEKAEIDKQVLDMLKAGVIEKTASPWNETENHDSV